MSEMLNKVAKAIQDALEKPKYVVKISKVWECWDVQENKLISFSKDHSNIDDECDQLNALYTARKAIEALKTFAEIELSNISKYPATYCDCDLKQTFDSVIDAILSSDK